MKGSCCEREYDLICVDSILLRNIWCLKQLACTEGIKKTVFLLTYPAVRSFKMYRQWPNNIQGSGLSDREISFLMDRKGIERELTCHGVEFHRISFE